MTKEEKEAIRIIKKFNEENRTVNFRMINNAIDIVIKMAKEKEIYKKAFKQRMRYSHELEQDLFEQGNNYVVRKDIIREILKENENTLVDDAEGIINFYKKIEELVKE